MYLVVYKNLPVTIPTSDPNFFEDIPAHYPKYSVVEMPVDTEAEALSDFETFFNTPADPAKLIIVHKLEDN